MVSQIRPITAEDFHRYITLPENLDRRFELVAGEIVEKMVSSPRASILGAWLVAQLTLFVDEHQLGYVSGADGGYVVVGERYIPNAAYIAKARCPVIPAEAYNPLAPDIAVEVLSPSDAQADMRVKTSNYLAAGTVVWVIDPGNRVEVHRPGKPVQILGAGDMLEGGEVLPGFSLAVADILAR